MNFDELYIVDDVSKSFVTEEQRKEIEEYFHQLDIDSSQISIIKTEFREDDLFQEILDKNK